VKILLDTHALWWAVTAPERLSEWGRGALLDESNEICVSVVSWWELVVKRGRGGLEFPEPDRFLPEVTRGLGVESVTEIRARHVLEVEKLPLLHRDPFDRMLVAQARMERMKLMTMDAQVRAYPVEWVW
jgi:PIN domain nuclease of toxin-antitoxin system